MTSDRLRDVVTHLTVAAMILLLGVLLAAWFGVIE